MNNYTRLGGGCEWKKMWFLSLLLGFTFAL